jgi:ribosomal protein S18 acetylase RimI-like enzyme
LKEDNPFPFITLGTMDDVDEMEQLYNDVNDDMEANENFPGWIKGVYPIRETAKDAIQSNTLFVYRIDNEIVGSLILNHNQEPAYKTVKWHVEAKENEVFVVHTLVVHPTYFRQGVSKKLLEFATYHANRSGVKYIRLDVSQNNTPAINVYEKHGYQYIDTVDLGLPYEHLKWFRLYELIV